MKKMIVFTLLAIVSVGGVFAEKTQENQGIEEKQELNKPRGATEMRAITVKQSIRYGGGKYSELLTADISKIKAIKVDKGKVYLKYDFFVEKSSSRNDIVAVVYFPPDIQVYPTGIDGAVPVEKTTDTKEWSCVKESKITNVYAADSGEFNFVTFDMIGKKGTVASVEFQLDVSQWTNDTSIDIRFFPIKRKRGVWGVVRDYIIPGGVLGILGISGMFIKDLYCGEFKNNPYEDSNRTFLLVIKE